MLAGPIAGSVAILRELRDTGTPLYALSRARPSRSPARYDFLGWFAGIVVSGHERLVKPDPRLHRALLDRHDLRPDDLVYIDDNAGNAEAASRLGLHGLQFADPDRLRADLVALGLLAARAS
jgi:2-haloacid dehalogenase